MNKKSKYRHVVLKKNKYYFYKITWVDILGDSGHATAHEFSGMVPSVMVTNTYLYERDSKCIRTFSSYDEADCLFSYRNVFPKGCIVKMEKILL